MKCCETKDIQTQSPAVASNEGEFKHTLVLIWCKTKHCIKPGWLWKHALWKHICTNLVQDERRLKRNTKIQKQPLRWKMKVGQCWQRLLIVCKVNTNWPFSTFIIFNFLNNQCVNFRKNLMIWPLILTAVKIKRGL